MIFPIQVDSNEDQEVAEIDSIHVEKTTTIQVGTYKPVADGKPLKHQRKLISNVVKHYEFFHPSQDGNLFCRYKKYEHVYPRESKNGTGNLKRHLDICKKRNFRDIGQLLLESRSGFLGNRHLEFNLEEFYKLVAACIVKHDLAL